MILCDFRPILYTGPPLRLVSPLTEVEAEVKEALDFYTSRNNLILVRDPNYLVKFS